MFKKHRDFFESVISLNDALNEITGRGGAADPREKLIINLALMGMTDAVAIITPANRTDRAAASSEPSLCHLSAR